MPILNSSPSGEKPECNMLRPILLKGLIASALLLLTSTSIKADPDVASSWQVTPAYETPADNLGSTGLIIQGSDGVRHDIYSKSTAVLIIEGDYRGSWQNVAAQGRASENRLREALEKRGYKVIVWRDLTGANLKIVLDELVSNLGHDERGRLFLYFFGHGTVMGTPTTPAANMAISSRSTRLIQCKMRTASTPRLSLFASSKPS